MPRRHRRARPRNARRGRPQVDPADHRGRRRSEGDDRFFARRGWRRANRRRAGIGRGRHVAQAGDRPVQRQILRDPGRQAQGARLRLGRAAAGAGPAGNCHGLARHAERSDRRARDRRFNWRYPCAGCPVPCLAEPDRHSDPRYPAFARSVHGRVRAPARRGGAPPGCHRGGWHAARRRRDPGCARRCPFDRRAGRRWRGRATDVRPLRERLHALARSDVRIGWCGVRCRSARRRPHRHGSILAQDEATCAVWGMPRAVLEAGLACAILPPDKIARWIASRTEEPPACN